VGLSAGCGDYKKKLREHVASLLPFRVLEAAGMPLRISGVAMAAGMSRNFNVYTVEELQAFADKLVGAPVYIEHVSVNNAAGKVTKSIYDAKSRCLIYEAEIYDQIIADKIRNGLIQHVSVGADYDAVDLVDAKVPHGLSNPELSLVAVPGIPETNIQVLEHLRESLAHPDHGKVRLKAKELLSALSSDDLSCVFCGQPGEYLVSTCTACGDNAQSLVLPADALAKLPEAYLPSSSGHDTFKVRFQALGPNPCEKCKALDGKEFVYGTQPALPIHENCKCGYDIVERLHVHFVNQNRVEKLEEKDLDSLAEKVAVKVGEKISQENVDLKRKVAEADQAAADSQAQVARSQQFGIGIKKGGAVTKPAEFSSIADDMFADPVNYRYPVDAEHAQAALAYFNVPENRADYSAEEQAKILAKIVGAALAAGIEVKYQPNDAAYNALPEELKAKCQGYTKELTAAEKLVVKEAELTVAKQTVEKLKKLMPGVDLLAAPPVLMAVSEHVAVLEKLLPPMMAERSSMFSQRQAQAIRAEIFKAKEKLK